MEEVPYMSVHSIETADCEVGPKLLKKAPRSVKRTVGDGAYDTLDCYKMAYEKGQKLIVPQEKEQCLTKRKSHGKGLGMMQSVRL